MLCTYIYTCVNSYKLSSVNNERLTFRHLAMSVFCETTFKHRHTVFIDKYLRRNTNDSDNSALKPENKYFNNEFIRLINSSNIYIYEIKMGKKVIRNIFIILKLRYFSNLEFKLGRKKNYIWYLNISSLREYIYAEKIFKAKSEVRKICYVYKYVNWFLLINYFEGKTLWKYCAKDFQSLLKLVKLE